jgi:DNA-binding NtrC family response regulator
VSTILVVQPDPALNERWAEALSRGGHEILSVRIVGDGVARAREGGIDVIVLDAVDGDAAVRELVAELNRLPDAPPMILVSESPNAPELSAQVGAAGFLPKPCSSEDLVEVVERVASASVRLAPFEEETTSPRRKF